VTALLEAASLSRAYGEHVAVHDVTLRVAAGEVVGLLGHNGAGKSTTMRMLAGALRPTSGAAKVTGHASTTIEARRNVGWLPEVPPLTDELTVREQLSFAAGLRSLGAAEVDRALARCDLTALARQLNATLSKGTKQRVGLAQALLGDPSVVLLDEPTAGMDPKQAAALRDLVRSLSPTRAIVLSTHLLHEVTALCTRVVLVRAGRVVVDEPLAALRARGPSLEATVLALLDTEAA
jgi:ABC-2 type transport system ATP-binding protein